MAKDTGAPGVWDFGDEVLFSIRARNGWDGGEIVHWRFGAAADFLVHGGHKWDTLFSVAAPITVDREEVDAIEAVPVPEPAVWLGLVKSTPSSSAVRFPPPSPKR